MRVLGYIRVSTAEQASSSLGVDAQRAAMEAACRGQKWELVDVLVDAGITATARSRPALEEALSRLESTSPAAEALVVAKLERLAPSASVFGASQFAWVRRCRLALRARRAMSASGFAASGGGRIFSG